MHGAVDVSGLCIETVQERQKVSLEVVIVVLSCAIYNRPQLCWGVVPLLQACVVDDDDDEDDDICIMLVFPVTLLSHMLKVFCSFLIQPELYTF